MAEQKKPEQPKKQVVCSSDIGQKFSGVPVGGNR